MPASDKGNIISAEAAISLLPAGDRIFLRRENRVYQCPNTYQGYHTTVSCGLYLTKDEVVQMLLNADGEIRMRERLTPPRKQETELQFQQNIDAQRQYHYTLIISKEIRRTATG